MLIKRSQGRYEGGAPWYYFAMPGQGTLSLLIITVFVTAVGVLLVTTYGKLLLAAFSKPFTYAGEEINLTPVFSRHITSGPPKWANIP